MKTILKAIGMIFRFIWKTITLFRLLVTNLLFLFTIAIIYILYTQSTPEDTNIQIHQPSALVLNLSGPIREQATYVQSVDSIATSLLGDSLPKENILFDIVDTIRHAKDDEQISGLVLSLGEMSETNLTKLRYIAKAINEFKASGKPVFAVGNMYTQSQYYLASYADKILMSPDGLVMLKGYSAYGLYYKKLLDKLDVTTHIFRVGTYKSAVEPFMRNDMSDAAKASNKRWLQQLWDAYLTDVAANRNITPEKLRLSMDDFLTQLKRVHGDIAKLSLDLGLVDELISRPQMRAELTDTFGSDGQDGYRSIGYYDYLNAIDSQLKPTLTAKNEIAVIVASGTIMDGNQPRGEAIGSENMSVLLREARNDPHIKAVVLRVDSPGGSASASEVIRSEIDALKASGKPVVVSMSSLAASGGYWLSTSADQIVAQPTTLTGSIGIFSVLTTFEHSLDRIGVSTDGVGTTPFSGQGITTGLSDGTKQALQLTIEHGYQRFISLVAEHRHLSLQDVDKVAQGHVWTGQDALKFGLVDKMGDFDDAVALAAKLAKVDDYQLDWLEEPISTMQKLLIGLFSEARVSLGLDVTTLLPESLRSTTEKMLSDATLLNQLNDPKGQYAFCLNCEVE
ncbi:signal peptide peptidase SppA [Vibrio gazogenes]|uniref:Protease-4 n=1 Tax=Vibrio gazogenes DSM 21264 = NBRC 103151 TaxID=1123492 RepID=A0A1M5EX72_VIBGA|nr:signal peptide peptidase SppA [Vibrio gazogenes]USP14792.1 signal peptide peptidase SppA [Vibrio gazogenes]SHF83592.1 protease-4 [Vibrio gazogenes DSM 21264] [Vibrio gazogenes DSM 21264 = NBRC 103151]SJN55175.1 Protease 4 [Vibrio gazogenes]